MPAYAETERLILRAFKEDDTPRLFQLMDDLRIRRGEPYSLAPNHPSFANRIPEMIKGSMAWVCHSFSLFVSASLT
jgi:RimJ/RimL family protein N-acetyltransferase